MVVPGVERGKGAWVVHEMGVCEKGADGWAEQCSAGIMSGANGQGNAMQALIMARKLASVLAGARAA